MLADQGWRYNFPMRRLYLTLAVVSGVLLVFWAGVRFRNTHDGAPGPQPDGEQGLQSHRPFEPLPAPRPIGRNDLPDDLAKFYAENEGNGLECSPDNLVRLCRLSEVRKVTWRQVPIFGSQDVPGWGNFEGYYIGISSFGDRIYWAQSAPGCDRGAILTIGPDVAGPGGRGSADFEPSLVLASSFASWLAHLERHGWVEYGLVPGEISQRPADERAELRAYFLVLNSSIKWGAE